MLPKGRLNCTIARYKKNSPVEHAFILVDNPLVLLLLCFEMSMVSEFLINLEHTLMKSFLIFAGFSSEWDTTFPQDPLADSGLERDMILVKILSPGCKNPDLNVWLRLCLVEGRIL